MGLIAKTIPSPSAIRNAAPAAFPSSFGSGLSPMGSNYLGYSGAYMRNEIVFAAIEMLATSAGEPHIMGKRRRRAKPQIGIQARVLKAKGLPDRLVDAMLIRDGFIEEVPDHPLVLLLNAPNPFMSRSQLWGTVVMDRCLAGNAYIYKARGPLGNIVELWRLRPDRIRIIPGGDFIAGYEYNTGRDKVMYPPGDIMHFKTRHPVNDYYGMPPIMAIASRIDIDDYMKNFLKTFFERGGAGIGGVLNVKQALSQEKRDGLRDLMESRTAGPANWHKNLILDAVDATYTPMGLNRGLRDALPKELDAVSEARIAMAFGIPGSILGLLIGYESSSYANKRQDWQVFWDLTMTPLLSDLDDVLNLSIVPDFAGVDEVAFDLADIRALQEDIDKIHERHRKNWLATLESFEEARDGLGLDPTPEEGMFLIPANMTAMQVSKLDEVPPPPPVPQLPPATAMVEGLRATFTQPQLAAPAEAVTIVDEAYCDCGRLLGKDLNVGGKVWCARCKKDVAVGK